MSTVVNLTTDDAEDDAHIVVVIVIAAVIVALAAMAMSLYLALRRWRTADTAYSAQVDKTQDEDGIGVVETPEPTVVAKVAEAFHPGDVEDQKSFRESCLELEEGDTVEVVAGGSGWLYGRVLGGDDGVERAGYFPENRVAWYGRSFRHDRISTVDEGMLVTPHYDFSLDDIEDACWKQSCLTIRQGEVVEVMAAGGGWLYGRVAGSEPERAGYFPENRVAWLCASSEDLPGSLSEEPAAENAAPECGWLVRVGASFSPGTPGDAAEELADQTADFGECCLALAPGDVVEVAASAGGWLYGRVVGAPDRIGYFPENRVCWVGRPVNQHPQQLDNAEVPEASTSDDTPDIAALRVAAREALGDAGPAVCEPDTSATATLVGRRSDDVQECDKV